MPIEPWIVVGAGGHARVVMDALRYEKGDSLSYAFADDDVSLHGQFLLGVPVLGAVSKVVRSGMRFHIAVGMNRTREMLYHRMLAIGAVPFAVAHPSAIVSKYAQQGVACFIAARAVVAPAASIGVGAIINHGAVIDHDCLVGDFAHIAPGATLGGGVSVGRDVLIGAGANVLPGLVIGDGAVIGAGAVVVADVSSGARVVGVPARMK